jgi:stearoyl-CoA desaturase (delta-9 desaturase)
VPEIRSLGSLLEDLRENPGKTPAFLLVHLGCLLVLVTGFRWQYAAVCAVTYTASAFGISAGYHRYFSHRSFKTGRVFQLVLAFLGTLAIQRGILWWAGHHRRHHQVADREGDLHSPSMSGFLWAHVGWFLSTEHQETDWDRIRDFRRFPELVWLNEHYVVPPALLALGLYLCGGLPWLVWGFFVSTVALWHVTYSINTIAHTFGRRRFDTGDTSRNNALLGILAVGEGWHNNHHHYMHSARIGFAWWEIDVTYYALVILSWLGVVWDLTPVPERALDPPPRAVEAPAAR